MFRTTKEIHFCYGHRLIQYDGPCRHLHGHNGRAQIEIEGDTLDSRGMLADFRDVKNAMKEWIDRELDHRTLLSKDDPLADVLRKMGEPVTLFDRNPTAEAIARRIFDHARSLGLAVRRVRVWETESSFAEYSD